ncbi:Acylamidase [Azoarcus sp. Aa7]|nr:Acylamidase [Azoarcus sp. Aa7]
MMLHEQCEARCPDAGTDAAPQALPREIWRWSATEMAAQIANGTVSSREVVASCLARIADTNDRINAITHVDPEKALRAADAADAARSAGRPLGPLHGVPVTIKVNIDVTGEATTHGVAAKHDLLATSDSPVTSNVLRAGAVIVGRTNTPAFSLRWFTENDLHGRTLNPWHEALTPGGSSGGASAAVASGMCPIAHGNDLAGSIRYPAYACGVAGIRPTAGRVPSYTPTSGNARTFAAQLFAVQGPIARTVADLRLGLGAMAARDVRDPVWVPAPLSWPDAAEPCRVALIDEIDGVAIDPQVRDALHRAAAWLEQEGYRVERPAPPRLRDAADVWMSIAMTEIRSEFAETVAALADERARLAVRDMLAHHDPSTDLRHYIQAFGRRDALRREWNLLLEQFPLVLMPTSCHLPFEWGLDQEGPDALARILDDQVPLTAIAALNLPGLSVPTGLSDGVPVGVQLVAGAFREDRCLAAGEVIERDARMPNAYA